MIRKSVIKKLFVPLIVFTVISFIPTLVILIMQIFWSHYGFKDSTQISLNTQYCTTYQLAKFIYSKQLFGLSFIAILVNFCCEILLFIIFLIMGSFIFMNSLTTSDEINPDQTEDKLFIFPKIMLFYASYVIASLNILACLIHFGYYLSFYIQITDNCSASDLKIHYIVLFSLMILVCILAILIWINLMVIAILAKPDQIDEKNQQRKKFFERRRRTDSQHTRNQLVHRKQVQLTRDNLLDSPGRNENLQTDNQLNPKNKEQNPNKKLIDDRKILFKQNSEELENNRKRKNININYYKRNFQTQHETQKNATFFYQNRKFKSSQQDFKEENQQLKHLRPKQPAVSPLFFEDSKSKALPTPKFNHHPNNEMKSYSSSKKEKYQSHFDEQKHFHHRQNLHNQQNQKQQSYPHDNIYLITSGKEKEAESNKDGNNSNKKDRKGMLIDYIKGKYPQ